MKIKKKTDFSPTLIAWNILYGDFHFVTEQLQETKGEWK